jgi:hypothetical protein
VWSARAPPGRNTGASPAACAGGRDGGGRARRSCPRPEGSLRGTRGHLGIMMNREPASHSAGRPRARRWSGLRSLDGSYCRRRRGYLDPCYAPRVGLGLRWKAAPPARCCFRIAGLRRTAVVLANALRSRGLIGCERARAPRRPIRTWSARIESRRAGGLRKDRRRRELLAPCSAKAGVLRGRAPGAGAASGGSMVAILERACSLPGSAPLFGTLQQGGPP